MRTAVQRDKVDYLVRQKLDAARTHVRNGDYRAAEKLLLDAQELDPTNRAVRTELRDVQALRGRRPAGAEDMLQTMRQLTKVRIDEQRTTASKFVNLGRMHLTNGRFDDAIENFEQASFIIESSPYEIDWQGLREDATRGLREARSMKEEQARTAGRRAVEQSLAEMAREEEQRLIAEQQRLERLDGRVRRGLQPRRLRDGAVLRREDPRRAARQHEGVRSPACRSSRVPRHGRARLPQA